jgi:hypothetical protein
LPALNLRSFLHQYLFIIAGLWYALNGILHDVFVLRAHAGNYDRELLRLLMDGHVLILSGALLLVCWQMARTESSYAYIVGLIVTTGMLVYCAMIFPFLKSVITSVISLVAVVYCAYRIWS